MNTKLAGPRPTFWSVVFAAVMAAALYAAYLRFFHGLGAATNLSDRFPWGLWIGFDVLCGVGLAAGGFTLVATVHIFNIERYQPILRPAILTAFLGYLLVIVALLFDLGRSFRIWHALVMWNPRSVMFEVAWCVMLYTTVLMLEFIPVFFERFGWRKALRRIRAISVPLVIVGVILSTLHQSSLGSLYLIVPEKLHPLWYTPLLPVLFFISAIRGAGDDNFRVLAQQQGFWQAVGVTAAGEHGARISGADRGLSHDSRARFGASRRGSAGDGVAHRDVSVRHRNCAHDAADAAAFPEPRAAESASTLCLRRNGRVGVRDSPAERFGDGHGSQRRRGVLSALDGGCRHAGDRRHRICGVPAGRETSADL
jgi:hypothetical protein